MKRSSNTTILAAAAVLSLVLLAGCRELPGKEAADQQLESRLSGDIHQETAEILKQEVGKVTASVEQAVQNTAAQVADEINKDSVSKEISTSVRTGSASILSLNNSVGEVEIVTGSGEELKVKTTIQIHKSLHHDSDLEILENAVVSVQIDGDKLKVSTHPKDNDKKDLWTWAQKQYGYSDFSISYYIELPSAVDTYKVHNDVGNVRLSGLKGTYEVVSNVGSVTLEAAEITEKSRIESNTGSIALDLRDMKNGSSLKVKSDIGKITATLADELKCTLDASTELGQVIGTSKKQQDMNGGGPLLSLSSQIGSITVRNP